MIKGFPNLLFLLLLAQGKTGTNYPFTGHQKLIPLVPWELYTGWVKIFMEELLTYDEDDTRAMIITTNYVYPFVKNIVTVDVIIEFLACGLSAPRIQVDGIKLGAVKVGFDPLRGFILVLLVLFTLYTIAMMCRMGLKEYFLDPSNITEYLAVLALAANVSLHELSNAWKYSAIQDLTHSNFGVYTDIHSVYTYENYDSFCLLFVFLILLIDIMLIVPKLIGSEWFKRFLVPCIRIALLCAVLEQFAILMARESAQMIDYSYCRFFILIHTNQIPSLEYNSGRWDPEEVFYFAVILLSIIGKGLTAMIIYKSFETKGSISIPFTSYMAILKMLPDESKPTSRRDGKYWKKEFLRYFPIPPAFRRKPSAPVDDRKTSSKGSSASNQLSTNIERKHSFFFQSSR